MSLFHLFNLNCTYGLNSRIDPLGEFVPVGYAVYVVASVAVSAAIAVATDLAYQWIAGGGSFGCGGPDWGEAGIAALVGAVPGGFVARLLYKLRVVKKLDGVGGAAKSIDDVISSALRPARAGSQDSRSLQALKKKIDRGDDAFSGLPKTQDAANDLIRQTLSAKNPVVRTRTRNGQIVRDVFDPSTGRGVRTVDGAFDTFVNLK